MSHTNSFRKPNQNLTSSENTRYKRQKTIFKGAVNVAENGGKLEKGLTKMDSAGNKYIYKKKGTYVGNIYTTTKEQKLIGAKNYESLYDVTIGKYLADPLAFGIANGGELWQGSIYVEDLSGVVTIAGNITSDYNRIIYPPDPNASFEFTDGSNNQAGGIYVDPLSTLFYPIEIASSSSDANCYKLDALSYLQHVTYQSKFYKKYAERYLGLQNGIISPVIYPATHLSLKCDENWIKDISNGIIWNGYVPGYKFIGRDDTN